MNKLLERLEELHNKEGISFKKLDMDHILETIRNQKKKQVTLLPSLFIIASLMINY